MSIGNETYQITQRGWVFAFNIYASQLGSTSTTNNFYLILQINTITIGDSQSYVPLERGGSIGAMVSAGDTVRIMLLNHDIDNCMLIFVPMVE